MICGFNSTKNAKGGTQDGIIHPDGQSTANCTIDLAISLESFEHPWTCTAKAVVFRSFALSLAMKGSRTDPHSSARFHSLNGT